MHILILYIVLVVTVISCLLKTILEVSEVYIICTFKLIPHCKILRVNTIPNGVLTNTVGDQPPTVLVNHTSFGMVQFYGAWPIVSSNFILSLYVESGFVKSPSA